MNRNIDTNTVYVLNPGYSLKVDKKRVIIINSKDADILRKEVNGFVHPVYAVLMSLFDGKRKLEEVIEVIGKILKTSRSIAADLIFPMLENEEPLNFKYDGYFFHFPEKVLVEAAPDMSLRKYDMDSFFIPKKDLDMESLRLYSPINAMLMINTLCATDCIYCYADKRKNMDCNIPMERLREIIREANNLDMRSIDVTGGELFLYSQWEELLAELLSNGFHPYISTKFPIGREIVYKLKNLGIKRIQISLDSFVAEELMLMLNVGEDYYPKIIEAFKILDESGLEIYTNSQISSINQDSIYKLLDFLLNLRNVKRISMGAVGFSLYKGGENYLRLRPKLEKVREIEDHVNRLKADYQDRININFSGYLDKSKIIFSSREEKENEYKKRSKCTANFSAFIILPDGKVTICEELYWHPQFIIGDVMRQSIEEVWNSKRALELYNFTKDMVRVESTCSKCIEFDACRKNRGVCWKEILYAYGSEKWDYPDPKCHLAPNPFREYYL